MKRYLLLVCVLMLSQGNNFAQTKEVVDEINQQLEAIRKLPPEERELRDMLINHPEMKLYRAKMQLAEAELEQAKLQLTQKFMKLKAQVKSQQAAVEVATVEMERAAKMHKEGAVPVVEKQKAANNLEAAKAVLASLNSELDSMAMKSTQANFSLTLSKKFAEMNNNIHKIDEAYLSTLKVIPALTEAAPGSPQEKLKANIAKPIVLDLVNVKVTEAITTLNTAFDKSITIKLMELSDKTNITMKGEYTLSAWLELISDEYTMKNPDVPRLGIYVREYGILIVPETLAPRDATRLKDFTKIMNQARQAEQTKTKP